MKKIISKIILCLIISINIIYSIDFVNALDIDYNSNSSVEIDISENKEIDLNQDIEHQKESNDINNNHLDNIKNKKTDYDTNSSGGEAIYNTLINIAKNMKNAFFFIATVYFFVLVIKLIFAENTDEQATKFKKGIIWISIGLIITQIAYSFVDVLYSKSVGEKLAYDFSKVIIQPLIKLLETGASFVFIAIAIIAFFKLITANGSDDKAKSAKMSIFYGIIGFVVIKFSGIIVDTIYGTINCDNNTLAIFDSNQCVRTADLSGFAQNLVKIINWVNGFLGILIIILIIYTGLNVIFNLGDEDRLKKAKKSIIYIIVGLFLLVVNYMILTFFLVKETPTLIN